MRAKTEADSILIGYSFLRSLYYQTIPPRAFLVYLSLRAGLDNGSDPPTSSLKLHDLNISYPTAIEAVSWLDREGWIVAGKGERKNSKSLALGERVYGRNDIKFYADAVIETALERESVLRRLIEDGLAKQLNRYWPETLKKFIENLKEILTFENLKEILTFDKNSEIILYKDVKKLSSLGWEDRVLLAVVNHYLASNKVLRDYLAEGLGIKPTKAVGDNTKISPPTPSPQTGGAPDPPLGGSGGAPTRSLGVGKKVKVKDKEKNEKKSWSGLNVPIFERFDLLLRDTPFLLTDFRGVRRANPAKIEETVLADHDLTLDAYARFLITWCDPVRIASAISNWPGLLWTYKWNGKGTKPPIRQMIDFHKLFLRLRKENRQAFDLAMVYMDRNPERKTGGEVHLRKAYDWIKKELENKRDPEDLQSGFEGLDSGKPFFKVRDVIVEREKETAGMNEDEIRMEKEQVRLKKLYEEAKATAGWDEMTLEERTEWRKKTGLKILQGK